MICVGVGWLRKKKKQIVVQIVSVSHEPLDEFIVVHVYQQSMATQSIQYTLSELPVAYSGQLKVAERIICRECWRDLNFRFIRQQKVLTLTGWSLSGVFCSPILFWRRLWR